MAAEQFIVRLSNRPGALADLLETFATQGLDVRSIGASGIGEHGTAVVVLNDAAAARTVLHSGNYTFVEAEALVTSAPDRLGELASMTRRLADAGINIQGLAILGWHQGKAELVLSVDNPRLAGRVLDEAPRPGHSLI